MTAALIRVPGAGDTLSADACRGGPAIFDGRFRYNLRLEYKRLDTITIEKSYQGPVVVCSIYFEPIAGYNPKRDGIKYLVAQRNMEIWLAPIAGTRLLATVKLLIPTPWGAAKLQATQYVTTGLPRGAAVTRTQ